MCLKSIRVNIKQTSHVTLLYILRTVGHSVHKSRGSYHREHQETPSLPSTSSHIEGVFCSLRRNVSPTITSENSAKSETIHLDLTFRKGYLLYLIRFQSPLFSSLVTLHISSQIIIFFFHTISTRLRGLNSNHSR